MNEIINNVMRNAAYIYYLDESAEDVKKRCIFSVIGIPIPSWNEAFQRQKSFRTSLMKTYGIQMYKELHATRFVNGRGRFSKIVSKRQRAEIYREQLEVAASMADLGVHTFCAIMRTHELALDRVLNRIESTMTHNKGSAVLIFDSGNEKQTRQLVRKMMVFNPIPSALGGWEAGRSKKNIPLEHIVGDIQFADSAINYFIQVIDFIAYSVKCVCDPSANVRKHGLTKSYTSLSPIILKQVTKANSFGVVNK